MSGEALAITPIRPGIGVPNGFSSRYAHFLRALAGELDLDVLLLDRETLVPLAEETEVPGVRRVWSELDGLQRRRGASWLPRRLTSPRWATPRLRLADHLAAPDYDLAVGLHYRSADVLLSVPRARRRVAVLEEHDGTLTHRSRRKDLTERLEIGRELRMLGRICNEVDVVVAISESEADVFRRMSGGAQVVVVPHGVDCQHFAPVTAVPRVDVGFFGMLTTGRDAGALRAASALTRAGVVRAHACAFVGASPSRAVVDWCASGALVTGRVQDMRPWYASSRVVVVADPHGPGVKTTVLEAWAMARPVVATSAALRGLAARDGENALVAQTDRELVEAVRALTENEELSRRIAEGGRRTVCAAHDLTALAEKFASICSVG